MIMSGFSMRTVRSGGATGRRSREKSPAGRCSTAPGDSVTMPGAAPDAAMVSSTGAPVGASSGAATAMAASPVLSLSAIHMAFLERGGLPETGRPRWSSPVSVGGADRRRQRPHLRRRDRLGRLHLHHQVVVPVAFDLEMRGGAEFDRLDEVMRHVGVDAGLQELVQRGPRRSAADEPGLEVDLRAVGELAGLP